MMVSLHVGGLRGRIPASLILIAAVVLNYGWTTGFGFVNDDYIWIAGIRFSFGDSWMHALVVSPAFGRTFVRPMVELSFFVNYLVAGMHPFAYHLLNLVVHAINVYLVWVLATALLESPNRGLAVALLFATHAAHPDAVTWVSGRTELLAGALVLSALLLHLRGRWVLAGFTFIVALLTKESALAFPLLALVVDCLGPHPRWRLGVLGGYVMLLLPYVWLRHATTQSFAQGAFGLSMLAAGRVGDALWLVGHQWVQLMRLLMTPLPLSAPIAAGAVLAVFSVALHIASDRDRRGVWLAGGWLVAACVPFLGFGFVQARYVYLPSIGWSLVLVILGRSLCQRVQHRRAPRLAVAGVATAWIVASVAVLQWSNEQLRRNGVASQQLIEAVAAAVPQPAPGTLFVLDGLGRRRMGFAPSLQTPVLMFGLPEALRMRFDDPRVDATFAEVFTPPAPDHDRPIVRLRWDEQAGGFAR